VGIDDTDSSSGSCTTYLAYRIARDLRPVLRVVAYPRLVRLNPNVPFKTRGNAAVCLPIDTEAPEEAFERITSLVSALSDVDHGANSGVVFLEDLALVVELKDLYQRAVTGLVNRHRVEKLLREHRVRTFTLGNGMGIVGAASSLPFCEEADHTYELIAYRRQENRGLKRFVEPRSVEEMDRETFPHTFNNFDYQKKKVLVAPHGPDPVFVGIRGDSPAAVVSAFARLRYKERLEGYMVYLSNQYTDAHLTKALDWKVYSSGWVEGTVQLVSVGPGGHLFIAVAEGSEKRICAVYEPTGDLRNETARTRRHNQGLRGCEAGDHVPSEGPQRREGRRDFYGRQVTQEPSRHWDLRRFSQGQQASDQAADPLRAGDRGERVSSHQRLVLSRTYNDASACSKSLIRSSLSSIPTDSRIRVSGIPVISRSAWVSW